MPHRDTSASRDDGGRNARTPLGNADALSRSLAGALPCITCRYDLQGLSVLAVCPECGSAVRATILAVVDPLADELRPILRPRLVAFGLIAWSVLNLFASIIAALAMIIAGWSGAAPMPWMIADAGYVVGALVWLAGVASLCFIHPHRGVGATNIMLASLGAACYAALGWVALHLTLRSVEIASAGILDMWHPRPDRTLLRLAACGLVVVIILCLRPNARLLVARSLALRTGRVDRQTLLAVAISAAIVAAGDALGFFVGSGHSAVVETIRTFAIVMMVLGGGLLLIGLAGVMVDSVRIAAAVITPSPSLSQLTHPQTPDPVPAVQPLAEPFIRASDLPTKGGGI